MDKETAIRFLKSHQPMPDDNNISKGLINEYDRVRKYFLDNQDEECIPLFLNSFGEINGYGVYQLVEDVIMKFNKDEVIGHLVNSLQSEYRSVRYWSAQISALFPDERLIEPLYNLLKEYNSDIKFTAIIALSQIKDEKIESILNDALNREDDEKISEFIKEVIFDLNNNNTQK